ncbi:MAG: ParB/Srx family N-terminal domain-containing protein, partial [Nitrosopumilus sp.]
IGGGELKNGKMFKGIGFKDPIVIDKDNMIFAGHGRLEAAKQLGMKKIPYIKLEGLSEDEKKVFMLMDNKVNESPWIAENVKLVFDQVDPIIFKEFKLNFENYFEKNIVLSEREWQDMPEFFQQKQDGYHRLMLGFETENDMIEFGKLINQNVSLTTRYLWYPAKPKDTLPKNWSDES